MELPQTLLDRYHVSKPKSKKEESIPPLFKTYQVLLTFDTGERLRVEITVKNKPYWAGQLEAEIKQTWNSDRRHAHKVTNVRVFRNATEGCFVVDNEHGRVINVY